MTEIHSSESGLNTSNRCFEITICPQDDESDESNNPSVRLALIFSHTEKYPDEPPLLNLKSLKGMHTGDIKALKEKLEQEAAENLGMAMIYTLVTSAQEWLSEIYAQDAGDEDAEEGEAAKDEVIVPHGEPVTVDSFLAWRERFEAELALERAKLIPDSALAAPKDKKLTGRQWFESGRAASKGAAAAVDEDEEVEEDIDFDDDDFEECYSIVQRIEGDHKRKSAALSAALFCTLCTFCQVDIRVKSGLLHEILDLGKVPEAL